MSQNDFVIADQTFPATLADLNAAFQALASASAGAAAPGTTYPYQFWADSTNNLLKMRNGANNAWLTLAKFDTANDRWEPRADILQALTTAGVTLRNSAGTIIAAFSNAGILSGASITVGNGKVPDVSAGVLTLADNQIAGAKVAAATTTTRGTVEVATLAEAEAGAAGKFPDAAGVAAQIAANIPLQLGVGQTWQELLASRAVDTVYQNTTGAPIYVSIPLESISNCEFLVSPDNVTFYRVAYRTGSSGDQTQASTIIPDGHYYKFTSPTGLGTGWVELR